jgi:hypothetical protein
MSLTIIKRFEKEILDAAKMTKKAEDDSAASAQMKKDETPEQQRSRWEQELAEYNNEGLKEQIILGILREAAQYGRENSNYFVNKPKVNVEKIGKIWRWYTVIIAPTNYLEEFFPKELYELCENLSCSSDLINDCIWNNRISADQLVEYSKMANGKFAAAYDAAMNICKDHPQWEVKITGDCQPGLMTLYIEL